MPKLARLPANDRAPEPADADVRRTHRVHARYYAFLSYSHKDEALAGWLHHELERFRVPHSLAGRLSANGVIPKRLTPIFRDEHELAAADDLGEEIKTALASSQFLIVLCSPNAAQSRWTNAEVEAFKRVHPDGCVLAAIAAGEPFASDIAGREHEECFPPALRQKYDRRGRPTGKRAEPLAADLRGEGEERRLGFLKLVAGMLGVGLDELVQRDTTRRHRRLGYLAAASLAGMAVTSTLAITAIQARDAARDQRREAEGLVAFMLGDLKDKLEPIGKLDALDGVGARVLAYYSGQDASDLSDASLLQRSRALSLTAEVAYQRGNLDTAVRLYREAMAGTAEAIRRNPQDPQRLFDHAQNVFWIGEIARGRGQLDGAESAFRDYKRLATQMVQIDPDNIRWRMEDQYADANLGIVLYEQRRFAEAAAEFEQALRTIEGLATANPNNRDYQRSVSDTLAWLADTRLAEGRLDQAIAHRRRNIQVLNRLVGPGDGNVDVRLWLIPAHRALGHLYAARGDVDAALGELRSAVSHSAQLVRTEPANRNWMGFAANARLNLGEQLLVANQLAEAAAEIRAGCDLTRSLIARDPTVVTWRIALRDCQLMRVRLAMASGAKAEAQPLAQQALDTAKSVRTNDPVGDRYMIAKAYRLVGDVQRANGGAAAGQAAWEAAARALPRGVTEKPAEMAERLVILQRLGQRAEAAQVGAKLRAMGYQRV